MKATIRNTRAMTLVELLVVMTIIAIMAAMLGLVVPSVTRRMNEAASRANINKLIAILQLYYEDCGQYPDAINHNPQRKVQDVPTHDDNGTYPNSTVAGNRLLYGDYYIESWGRMSVSELVGTLGGTTKGWGRPQFAEVFNRHRDLTVGILVDVTYKEKQLCDGWGRRIFYLPYYAYRMGPGGSGAVMILKNKQKGPFQNGNSYQIYSAGENLKTGLDSDNKGGTDVDDITNWGATTD